MDEAPRIAVVAAVIAASWLAFGRRLLDLRRRPGDAAVRATCLALGGLALAMTAQFAAARLDTLTGTPNLGRFLGNAATMIGLCGGKLLVDAVARTGPRTAWRHVIVLVLALAVAAVLFAATPPQPESSLGVRSHPTHAVYSSPYVYVYLGYVAYALRGIAGDAWRLAAAAARPPTRLGLRAVAAGAVCGLAYCVVKAVLLAATQLGADVGEWEYRTVGPLYLAAATSMLAGVAVPAAAARGGPLRWVRRLRAYRRLRPLWEALYRADPAISLVRPLRVHRLEFHLYRRVVEIRDGELALRPYWSDDAERVARGLADAAGLSGDLLAATVEAAGIAVALDLKTAGPTATAGASATARASATAGSSATAEHGAPITSAARITPAPHDDDRHDRPDPADLGDRPDPADLDEEIRYLSLVARQFATSSVVPATRAGLTNHARD